MDPRLRISVEIETIHELLPELDYYRLLQVPQDAGQKDVERAYKRESRRLHPDRVSALGDETLSRQANAIYRRLSEGHRTLMDSDLRSRYDDDLAGGSNRVSDASRKAADHDRAASSDPELAATHPKGEKYWQMGMRDLKSGNFRAAVMNMQFAMNYEPDNAVMKEWFAKAQAGADEQKQKDFNPYKLRIV